MKKLIVAASLTLLAVTGCSANESTKVEHAAVQVSETSDKTFVKDVLQAKQPVLVDFYATWCGPCKAMAPTVDEVADQFAGKIKVFKVDVDKNPQLSQALQIESIPTLATFKAGRLINISTGLIGKTDLVSMVEHASNASIAHKTPKPTL